MKKEYKYSLIKGSKKLTCPQCGRPKCFKPYINNETGEVLHPDVGRCDHEQSCQYHYTPHEYFQDHPDERESDWQNRKASASAVRNKVPAKPLPTYHQTEFFPLDWAVRGTVRTSTFRQWFESLPFDDEKKKDVLAEYYVGATKEDVCRNHVNYGKPAVFWMIDEKQQVHDAKVIAYQINGHRVEGWANSMRAICLNKGFGPQLDVTEKVLFGLHLLPKYPDKVVCIVESEKTALVCACKYDKFIWLATGGCGNLQVEKLKPLMDRRLVVYPDSGECEKWKARMAESGHPNYTVMDFIEKYEANTDLADVLLGTARLRPTTAEQTWEVMKADHPVLNDLEAMFGPVEVCPF